MNEYFFSACPCYFRRKQKGRSEHGVAVSVNGSVMAIIDKEGKRIPTPWNYNLQEYLGCFHWEVEDDEKTT